MNDYTYSENLTESAIDAVHALLKDTYWASERTRSEIETSLKASTILAAFHNGTLVGCARAVTDRALFSWICDVVVAPAHRGKGIGKELVARLMSHPHVAPTRKILVTRDAQGLYGRFGFIPHPAECMIAYPDKDR